MTVSNFRPPAEPPIDVATRAAVLQTVLGQLMNELVESGALGLEQAHSMLDRLEDGFSETLGATSGKEALLIKSHASAVRQVVRHLKGARERAAV